jgi:signal transduction histidine kinase
MRRPWYAYVLLFIGTLILLGAVFQPVVGATVTDPGGVLGPKGRFVRIRAGSPLDRAGAQVGDRFIHGDHIEVGRSTPGGLTPLRWKTRIPQAGTVELKRGEESVRIEVKPAPPAWPVRLAWAVIGLLNVGLVSLALALFWQHPRDGRAVLLGLVLLSAPVFWDPQVPRLLALTLAAHFFVLFPQPIHAPGKRYRPWLTALRVYLPFLVFGFIGAVLRDEGKLGPAAVVFNTLAIGYAVYGLWKVCCRWRHADETQRPVIRTLTVAAGAILAAVLVGISQRWWVISDQFVPANLLPAILFSGAVAHLVFRLRALEVRVMARRTIQYLLARWTLGTLFLIPGFLLVWRFGQLSVTHAEGNPREVLGLLLWMFLTALLLGKRQSVLRNLDRRFFRDVEAARQALIQLTQELGGQTEPEGVLATLEKGVRQALRPRSLHFALPDVPAGQNVELVIPVHRGEVVLGCLELGPKESGQPYSGEEKELLEAAAVQAAMALENARLSAALLARQRAELTARTAGVLAGAEEERRRLAADLHDQVLPELRQIAGEVEQLKDSANGSAAELERLETDIRGTMDSVREVMEALRPSALDMLGLGDALESYLRKGASRCTPPIAVSVRRSGEEPSLAPEQSLALYRICQEAINNVLKHSGARRAGLEVNCMDAMLSLVIWDDGCGVDPEAVAGKGHGFANIRYRADLIGAAVEWQRPESGGTRVGVVLPVKLRTEG